MNEHEFDSLFVSRPFGTEDAARMDAQLRCCATLAVALWGRTSADLERQLVASHPSIPQGFDLADFLELLRMAQAISVSLHNRKKAWLAPLVSHFGSRPIFVGDQRFTTWEACCEITRRAIEYLEGR